MFYECFQCLKGKEERDHLKGLGTALPKRSTWVGSLLLLLPLFFVGIKKEGRAHRVEEKKKKHKRSVQLSLSLSPSPYRREREVDRPLLSI